MKYLPALLVVLAMLLLAGCSDSSSNNQQSSYAETKMTLEQQEKMSPLSFLSANGTYRRNLVGKWVLEGDIDNRATIANYKDIKLMVLFYSKTKTLIGSESYVVYEYFPSGQSKPFTIKLNGPRGTDSIGFEIESATAVN